MADRTFELKRILARTRSDATLFERALRGDAAAFSEVYRRYHPRVYAFCLSRSLDPALAEDAAQETFIRFLKADGAAIDNPLSWMFAVARNVCVDLVRQRSRSEDVTDDATSFGGVSADSGEQAAQREQGRQIMLALRRLRPRYRSALILREMHGLSSAEMAEALETTPGAVDTLVSRARDAFGRLYSEVSDLPEACKRAFPLIYKSTGTGLDAGEQARLDAHLAECERCRGEAKRVDKPGRLSALLPFLLPLGESKSTGLGQLLGSLDPTLLAAATSTPTPATQQIGMRVAAVALAVTAVAAVPASQAVVSKVHPRTPPSTATATSRQSGVVTPATSAGAAGTSSPGSAAGPGKNVPVAAHGAKPKVTSRRTLKSAAHRPKKASKNRGRGKAKASAGRARGQDKEQSRGRGRARGRDGAGKKARSRSRAGAKAARAKTRSRARLSARGLARAKRSRKK